MPAIRGLQQREHGQMAVEIAIVAPVLLLLTVFAFDALLFASECARFEHLACQSVIAQASSPAKDCYDAEARRAAIQKSLAAEFNKHGSSVEVSASDAGAPLASMTAYRCTFKFAPWPLSMAGAPAKLEHSCTLVIDPYTPGELL